MSEENKVDHPSHYNREGAMECIDEMILLFGEQEVATFCKLNAWKYRYRAADKNGVEDLKKSDWYLNKYKELKAKPYNYYITTTTTPGYTIDGNSITPCTLPKDITTTTPLDYSVKKVITTC